MSVKLGKYRWIILVFLSTSSLLSLSATVYDAVANGLINADSTWNTGEAVTNPTQQNSDTWRSGRNSLKPLDGEIYYGEIVIEKGGQIKTANAGGGVSVTFDKLKLTNGGNLLWVNNSGTISFNSLKIAGKTSTSRIWASGNSQQTLNLSGGSMIGEGKLSFYSSSAVSKTFTIETSVNLDNFNGILEITVNDGATDADTTLFLNAVDRDTTSLFGVSIGESGSAGGGLLSVGAGLAHTFRELSIAGSTVAPGVYYSLAEIVGSGITNAGDYIIDWGAGTSITVVPEPAGNALFFGLMALAFITLRRQIFRDDKSNHNIN